MCLELTGSNISEGIERNCRIYARSAGCVVILSSSSSPSLGEFPHSDRGVRFLGCF